MPPARPNRVPRDHPVATVGALISNPEGQILLVRTHKWGHTYGIPGGKIEKGETAVAALRREIREETGLVRGTLTDWRRVNRYEIWPQWRARYAPGVTHNTEHVFGFTVPEPKVATLDPAEHVSHMWMPWQDAMTKVFSPTNRDAIWQLPRRVIGHRDGA